MANCTQIWAKWTQRSRTRTSPGAQCRRDAVSLTYRAGFTIRRSVCLLSVSLPQM